MVWVLHRWYRDMPETDVSLAYVLGSRLLVTALNLYFGYRLSARRVDHSHGPLGAEGPLPGPSRVKGRRSSDSSAPPPVSGAEDGAAGPCPQADAWEEEPGSAHKREPGAEQGAEQGAGQGAGREAQLEAQQEAALDFQELQQLLSERPLPTYRPFLRLSTTLVKIPWGEPEDMGPTFREDLAAAFVGRDADQHMLQVYVRRGCIELTIVAASWRGGGAGLAPSPLPTDSLLCSLKLPPEQADARPVQVRMVDVAGEPQWVPDTSSGQASSCAAVQLRAEGVAPRVLLLPQPPPAPSPAGGQGPATTRGGTGWPVRLQARVGLTALHEEGAAGGKQGSAPEARALALSGGRFLAARVVSSSLYDSSAVYDIELLEAPAGPGPVLFELELGSWGVGARLPLPPLLATADPAVAAELAAAVEAWPAEGAAELSGFLLDLGTWLETVHVCPAVPHRAGLRGLPPDLVNLLARHLAGFAQAAGLTAIAASIAAQQAGQAGQAAVESGALQAGGAAQGAGQRSGQCLALLRALGLAPAACAEREAYRAFSGAWAVALARTGVVVDLLLLGSNFARGLHEGQALLSATTLTVLAAFATGALLAAAWPFLPRTAWERWALRGRVPRYCGTLFSSLVFQALSAPAPATASSVGGVGMLVLEGVVLPLTCLVSPLEAAAIACVKLPFFLLGFRKLDPTTTLSTTLFLIARAQLAAIATASAFHAYVRARFQRRAAKGQASAPGGN
ncbi:hypothetical protein HYH03_015540 [Edaphochlamys debaryana]|uniref:Uncharacterized protein n=1 Tax=Edaphochlamys debaryana TaxID=47281 RepID=A0A835XKX4_9CHLO|nr:hypothetical protein HYH03_015540 [Edaphochlamys debaryana]|eukprot:KAG2485731.1 hypothetical protein HYH03_015540 [Edaphochlamys debaryana]